MRQAQCIGLLLIIASALSFGLTLQAVELTNDWTTNWFVGYYHILSGDAYNWFFGYYHVSFVANDFNPFSSFYNPFPSVLGGICFLVWGIVFCFVKNENPRLPWWYWGNRRVMQLQGLVLSVGGALSLYLSMFSMQYQAFDHLGNIIYPYRQYGFPLALLGYALLTFGTVVLAGAFQLLDKTILHIQKVIIMFNGEKSLVFWVGLLVFSYSLAQSCAAFCLWVWDAIYYIAIYPTVFVFGSSTGVLKPTAVLPSILLIISGVIFAVIGLYTMKKGIKQEQPQIQN